MGILKLASQRKAYNIDLVGQGALSRNTKKYTVGLVIEFEQ